MCVGLLSTLEEKEGGRQKWSPSQRGKEVNSERGPRWQSGSGTRSLGDAEVGFIILP